MQQKLLITDLDNTLYDWVTFFTASFRSMVTELTSMLETSDNLLEEFKSIHQRCGTSEHPSTRMYVIMCYSSYSVRTASVGATSAICGLNSGGFIGVLATRVQRGITQGQHRLSVKFNSAISA
jgi:hypothetical protein